MTFRFSRVIHLVLMVSIVAGFLPVRAYGEDSDEPAAGARALSRAFREAVRVAAPAVVTVYSYGQNSPDDGDRSQGNDGSTSPSPEPDESLGPSPPPRSDADGLPLTGLGSGVIVDPAGRVITNNHVIDGARRVVVQLANKTEIVAREIHGDPASDIAVLSLDAPDTLTAAEYGDSDKLEIGDWVLAIGSPFKLDATVSAGIISAKDRTLQRIRRGRLLQTDAAINPGNSGGPLIDLNGRVIAISTAIATRNGGYQGIGFAIPINQARWIAEELAELGRVRRAAMGVRLAELNPKLAHRLRLEPFLGVLIYQVIDDSAADQAGLADMDVILAFNGTRVRDAASLQAAVEREPIGSTVPIRIQRDGKELTKQITLAPLEDPTAIPQDKDEGENAEPKKGAERARSDGRPVAPHDDENPSQETPPC